MNEIEPDLLNISESDYDLIKKLFPGRVRLDGELQLGVDGRHADVDLLRHPEVLKNQFKNHIHSYSSVLKYYKSSTLKHYN
jgi:hypothetical protein